MTTPPALPRNDAAWQWWTSTMKSPRYVMAPMVEGSELPFRQLCRRYGVDLCYSPMVQATIATRYWRKHKKWDLFFDTEETDRPLVFQIGGKDPATVLEGALCVQHAVDAVDLNLGCPQRIAQRGGYGAFLMSQPEVVEQVVRALSEGLKVPVCCKIRVLPKVEDTIKFAQMLQNAGCWLLTVHGRTKEQKGQLVGDADWNHIAAVKRAMGIPVILNGNVKCKADADRAMEATGCDAVMSAWGLLSNPRLFQGESLGPNEALVDAAVSEFHRGKNRFFQVELAEEYLAIASQYEGRGGTVKCAKLHLFKILSAALELVPELRDQLSMARDWDRLAKIIAAIRCSLEGRPYELAMLPNPRAHSEGHGEADECGGVCAEEGEGDENWNLEM